MNDKKRVSRRGIGNIDNLHHASTLASALDHPLLVADLAGPSVRAATNN
ncbi:MAG TPA: hypothetical protein VFC78_10200 [Tepidisphaeraceae bacterium]|nr:hypothetical protein [Tepidisphaeraceae bacterium]